MDGREIKWLAAILLVVAVMGAGWYFRDEVLPQREQPVVTPPESEIIGASDEDGPRHPVTPAEAEKSVPRELVPLPALDDSDTYFLLELVDAFGADIETLLVKDALIPRLVATIDNLQQSHVAEKIRPVGRLPEPFRVDSAGDNEPFYLGPDNYRRYDALLVRIAAADIDAVVDTYRRFYPLFQQSYERLGYPDRYFNDRVVEVIDHLLTTPVADDPIKLVRPRVLYEFADPELETLSSGQKLLLRLGPQHAATVKNILRDLRAELARP